MRSVERSGKTIDEAVQNALDYLRVDREAVSIEVIDEPKKGILGFGSKNALVRVTIKGKESELKKEMPRKESFTRDSSTKDSSKVETQRKEVIKRNEVKKDDSHRFKERPNKDKPIAQEPKTEPKVMPRESIAKLSKPQRVIEETIPAKVEAKEEVVDSIIDPASYSDVTKFLEDIIACMNIDATVVSKVSGEDLYVTLEGKDVGVLIGRRGITLDALQYLCNIVLNKDRREYIRVHVDSEDYRAKREATLSKLAKRISQKVSMSKRSVTLEPMNPYERRIIHSVLQGVPHIKTISEGEEPNRRVVVTYKRDR